MMSDVNEIVMQPMAQISLSHNNSICENMKIIDNWEKVKILHSLHR